MIFWRWLSDAPRREAPLAERCREIAERERRYGWAPYAAIAAGLAALLRRAGGAGLLARVAADIRAGRFDALGPERARLDNLLWQLATLKLRENNPDFIM